MRLAALILLLCNLGFLAWAMYAPEPGTVEPQLVAQQMKADAIRLLNDQQVAALAARKVEVIKVAACLEWGAFNTPDVPKARESLATLAGGARITERQAEEATGWWVYVPPQTNRQAANLKVAELRKLGVEDYFIVQDDSRFRFAVSLGIFSSEEAARARLERLRARGVRSAQVAVRQTPVPKTYLQVRSLPEELRSKLGELRDGYPGTDVKDCTG